MCELSSRACLATCQPSGPSPRLISVITPQRGLVSASKMVSASEPLFATSSSKPASRRVSSKRETMPSSSSTKRRRMLVCISDLHLHAYSDYQRVGVFYERVLDIAQD